MSEPRSAEGNVASGTRHALLLAGERLFALRGFEAVSISEVNLAAGVRNRSAIYYHFGSRAGLIDAIFECRFTAINPLRLKMLEEPGGVPGQEADRARRAVEALVHPLALQLHSRAEGNYYLRFLERIMREAPQFSGRELNGFEGWNLAEQRLSECFPHIDADLLRRRIALVRTLIVCSLAEIEAGGVPLPDRLLDEEQVLVDACLAVLSSPPYRGS